MVRCKDELKVSGYLTPVTCLSSLVPIQILLFILGCSVGVWGMVLVFEAYDGDDWRGDNDGWFRLSGDMGAMSQDKGSGQGLRGMEAPLTVSEQQPVMPVRAFFTPCFDKKQLSGCIVMCSFLPQVALRGMGTWWGDSRDKCSLRWITFEIEMITDS